MVLVRVLQPPAVICMLTVFSAVFPALRPVHVLSSVLAHLAATWDARRADALPVSTQRTNGVVACAPAACSHLCADCILLCFLRCTTSCLPCPVLQQRVTPDVQTGCISCASGDGKFGGPIWWNTPMDDADAEAEGADANRSVGVRAFFMGFISFTSCAVGHCCTAQWHWWWAVPAAGCHVLGHRLLCVGGGGLLVSVGMMQLVAAGG